MHRRPRLRSLASWPALVAITLLALALGAAAWLLLGSRAVPVRPAPAAADPACATLAARLPPALGVLQRRATTSRSPGVAAWGDPAVIWLCGVPQPGPSGNCLDVSGVDWIFSQLSDGTAFTTFGRDPAVQVLVPKAYAPEPLRLPPLSAVVAAVPQGPHRCT